MWYSNINFFGLVFTIVICSFIVLTDLVLLRSLVFFRALKRSPSPRLDRWIQDGVYQLQRHAYESHGHGVWKELNKEVPVTIHKTELPDLSIKSSPTAATSGLEKPLTNETTQTFATLINEDQWPKLEETLRSEGHQSSPGISSTHGGEDGVTTSLNLEPEAESESEQLHAPAAGLANNL